MKKKRKILTPQERDKILQKKVITKQELRKLREFEEEQMHSVDMIDYSLITDFIPRYARTPLAKSLSLLPHKVIDFITENYVFITQEKDGKGTHFMFDDPRFENKLGFILIADRIWKKKPIEIVFTIAHEVAHAFKGDKIDLKKEYKSVPPKFEKDADRLAIKWLSRHYSKKSLMRFANYLKPYKKKHKTK
jgi:hypothetical protein